MGSRTSLLSTVIAAALLVVGHLPGAPRGAALGDPTPTVRPAAVVGTFYPANRDELAAAVASYLAQACPARHEGDLVALIVPHAGFVYSGLVAAEAYRQVVGRHYDTVVVAGPSHQVAFRGFAVSGADQWETPLGRVKLDQAGRNELLRLLSGAQVFDPAHAPEHSIEVQLPFLQAVAPDATLLPVLMPDGSLAAAQELGEALARYAQGRSVLLVASSDMSHYPGYEDAVRVDREVLSAIERLDAAHLEATVTELLARGVPGLSTCLCGQGAVKAILVAARALGADRVEVLHYANSGDVPGAPRDRVVGYCAVGIYRSRRP